MLGVLRFTATLLWAIYTLELLSLRVRVFESIRAGLTASLTIGSLNLSLGNVLAFGVTIWAAFLLSKLKSGRGFAATLPFRSTRR